MSSLTKRVERVVARAKSKQRWQEQEPPKKKRRKEGSLHVTPGPADHQSSSEPSRTAPPSGGGTFEDSSLVEQGAQQPCTEDALLSSSGPSDSLSPLLSFDSTKSSREDYNERTPERTDLLTRLKSLLKVDHISSAFWACCQLCDMECLKDLVETAETRPNNVLLYDDLLSIIPSLWTQRFQDTSGAVSVATSTYSRSGSKTNSDGEKWVPRSKSDADLCKQRDNERCVLTKEGEPQAAHIFPYSMLNKHADPSHANHRAQSSFWRLLTGFWTEDRVAEWRNKIFPNPDYPDTGVDACFNLISLSPSAHWYWNKGCFALKPLEISDDEKRLTVQFFWQPQYSHGSKDLVDLLEEPLSSKDLRFAKKNGIECHLTYPQDDVSARYIQSGDIFTFTTDDPKIRPLPSWHLLDMQWVLQRLTAMSGAAGTPDVDLYDDDDMGSGSGSMLIPDDDDDPIKPSFIPYDDPEHSFNRVCEWIVVGRGVS